MCTPKRFLNEFIVIGQGENHFWQLEAGYISQIVCAHVLAERRNEIFPTPGDIYFK